MKPIVEPTVEQIYDALVLSEAHHLDGMMCDESNYQEFDDTVEKCALCSICIEYTTFGKRCTICVLHDEETACCKEWVSAHGAKDFVGFHIKQTALYKRIRRMREEYEEKCSEQSKFAENLNNALEKTQKAVKQFNQVRGYNESKQPKFKQGDSAMFCGEKVEILGLKETGNLAGKYRIRNWGVKHKGFYASESELSPISSKQPKFAVGKEFWWNGETPCHGKLEAQKVTIRKYDKSIYKTFGNHGYSVFVNDEMEYRDVYESSLSPLSEMYVGRKWILKQEGHEWNDLLVECVRNATTDLAEHESWWCKPLWTHFNETSSSIKDTGFISNHFIIICIDPAYWTGEICGEKVRVYEKEDTEYIMVIQQKYPKASSILSMETDYLGDRIWLAAIKDANIPIMPHSQSQGNYLPPEVK